MNDTLKQRLLGALILLLAAVGIGFLLPSPKPVPPEQGLKRVTIDLQSSEIVESTPAPVQTVLPPVIAAPAASTEPQTLADAAGDTEPQVEEPVVAERPPPAVAVTKSQPKAPPVQLKATETMKLPAALAAAPAPKTAPVAPVKPAASAAPAAKAAVPPVAPSKGPAKPPEAALPKTPPPAAAAPAKPAVPPPAPAPAAGGRWYVQVGSFSDVVNARQAEGRLKAAGLPTVLAPIETAKGTLYRVRVGPLPGESQAAAARSKAQQLGFAQAIAKQD